VIYWQRHRIVGSVEFGLYQIQIHIQNCDAYVMQISHQVQITIICEFIQLTLTDTKAYLRIENKYKSTPCGHQSHSRGITQI
jgi:hypothetical protein